MPGGLQGSREAPPTRGETAMSRWRLRALIVLVYVVVGIYVAWVYDYITPGLLRDLAEALLAVFLWFLVLLGIDLHIG
ncbi:hypothetical protein GCM10020001_045820 [Nonomuraea salmonea]